MRRSLTCVAVVAVVALGVSALSACGGDSTSRGSAGPPDGTADTAADDGAGGGGSGSGTDGESPAASGTTDDRGQSTTTTRGAAPTTTSPPYSFDGSVPPPDLHNTGTDNDAIFESLAGWGNWLKRHNPDVTLVGEAYVEGTDIAARLGSDLKILSDNNYRDYDVDQRLEVEPVSARDGIATLRVSEHVTSEQLLDAGGAGIDEEPINGVIEYIAVLSADADGRWRIAAIDQASADPRVEL